MLGLLLGILWLNVFLKKLNMQVSALYIIVFLAEGVPLNSGAAQVQVCGEWCCSLVGVASSGTVVEEDMESLLGG